MSDDEGGLLNILQAHGQSFLQSFNLPADRIKKRKCEEDDTNRSTKKSRNADDSQDDEYEEWTGIDDISHGECDNLAEDSDIDVGENDDDFTAQSCQDNVVIFSDGHSKSIANQKDYVSKAQMKAFMSSKVTKLMSTEADASKFKKLKADEEEDRTNAQNDAILHKLVHTKLLSGSLSTELELTPSQRRKALAGRVLELTGEAKLGKGEKLVREAERNKASKRVREGITNKQKERSKQELEEAKNLGNYHPTLKKVFEASSSTPTPRKREKGLKMGVGKFNNGLLRLSRDDISKATGGHDGGPFSSKGAHGAFRGKPRKQKSR
ncbi:hypothetical protein BYT27DRAFT_7087419 [Phlegmacium glaucopus]|nr:hypothetical protein BYT27DRAFT_7087419 [Phlegmacium glaucopus]